MEKHLRMNQIFKNCLLALVGIMSISMFNACQQNEFNNIQPKKTGTSTLYASQAVGGEDIPSSDSSFIVQNKDNSFSRFGYFHYKLFNDYAKENNPDSVVSKNEFYNEIREDFKDHFNNDSFLLSYTKAKSSYQSFIGNSINNKQDYSQLDVEYFFNYFNDNTSLSNEASDYLAELETDYENFQSVNELSNDIIEIEDNILDNSNLAQGEKEMLLSLLAISRTSLGYWNNVKNTASHDWHQVFTNNLNSTEQTELTLKISLGSGISYGLVFWKEYSIENHSLIRSHTSGVFQAAFQVGPATVATGEW